MSINVQGSTGFGSLGAVDDVVSTPAPGSGYASAEFVLSGTFSGTVSWEYTSDPKGANWQAAPYAVRTDAATSDEAVAPTATAAGTYEIPLPGDCVAVRARCTSYTSGSIVVQGGPGRIYVPGLPVVAVLFDVTVTAGGNNNTGTLPGTGWKSVAWDLVVATATSGAVTLNEVDDAGSLIQLGTSASRVAATYSGGLGDGQSPGTTFTLVSGLAQLQLPRRFSFTGTGATTSSIRWRIVARR